MSSGDVDDGFVPWVASQTDLLADDDWTSDDGFVPWVASQTALVADDWEVVS